MTVAAEATPSTTVTPAPAAPANPNPAPTGAEGVEGQGQEEEGQRPKRNGSQRAIDRQTRKFYEERGLRIAAEKELERYRAGQGGQKPTAPAQDPDAEPNADDFDNPKEFTKAVAKWAVRQDKKESSSNEARSRTDRQSQDLEEAFSEREDQHRETSDGYDDAVDNLKDARVRFAPTAIEFIQDIDKGPALLEHLGNNMKEAKRIAALSPARQVAELTRLEDKLPAAAASPRKVSGAPDPVTPVRTRASVEKNRDELTDADWVKRRKAELAKKQ